MLGDFMYCNPTRVFFGKKAVGRLGRLLGGYGRRVLFIYGCGSIKESGLYTRILNILRGSGRIVLAIGGISSNPTAGRLREACVLARPFRPSLILAAGGGSVCDFAKALSVSIFCDEDPWDRYFIRMQGPYGRIIPVGCIPTTAGTGSEMNGCAVISDPGSHLKIGHVFTDNVFPKFALLDPSLTLSVPRQQMACGIFDIMMHLTEQYFSGNDDNVTDYIIEGMMRSLISSSRAALRDPSDYEARSNIMWLSSLALSTLLSKGKKTDWMIHMIGQSIGAYTDASHGITLSVIAMPYYRFIAPYATDKMNRFAENVWNINPKSRSRRGSSDHLYLTQTSCPAISGENDSSVPDDPLVADKSMKSIGYQALDALEEWIRELGLPMNIKEIGVTEEMYDGIVSGVKILKGGYRRLTRKDVRTILETSAGYH